MERSNGDVEKDPVGFWSEATARRDLRETIQAHSEAAAVFFGEPAVRRMDPEELATIAFARRILSLSDAEVASVTADIDAVIKLVIQSGSIEAAHAAENDGVKAVHCSQYEPLIQETACIAPFPSLVSAGLWKAATFDAYNSVRNTSEEVGFFREAARQVLARAVGNG